MNCRTYSLPVSLVDSFLDSVRDIASDYAKPLPIEPEGHLRGEYFIGGPLLGLGSQFIHIDTEQDFPGIVKIVVEWSSLSGEQLFLDSLTQQHFALLRQTAPIT